MATASQGIGRQRYDFTDADVTVSVAGVPNVPGGGGVTGADFVQSVELVDEQFRKLMDGITAAKMIDGGQFGQLMTALANVGGGGGGSKKVQTVRVVDAQFQALMGSLRMLIARSGGGGPKTVIPYRDAATLVELVDPQFNAIMSGLQAKKQRDREEKFSLSKSPSGPSDFWSNFGNLFKQTNRLTNPNVYRAGRGKMKRLGLNLVRKGRAVSAGGGLLGKAGGAALRGVGGGLMKFAGPVGAAVAGADAVAGIAASAFKMATSAVTLFGEAAVKVAGNDGIGLITTGLKVASEALGKIPIVGQVFAAGLELATAGLNTFQSVLKAFTARGRELARYNPRIALAAATADVRKIFADIREANQNAGKYADLILKQQDIDEKFQRALQPLKEAIANILIKLAPYIEAIANDIGDAIKLFPAKLDYLADALNPSVSWAEANAKFTKRLVELEEEKKGRELQNADARNTFPNMLFNAANAIQLEDFVDPVNNQGGNKLNFPIKMGP
jgi:hypothetical protein